MEKKKSKSTTKSSSPKSGHHSDSEADIPRVIPSSKLKSYSQPLNKIHCLDTTTTTTPSPSSSTRSYSCPHYPRQGDPPPDPTTTANDDFIATGGNTGIFKLPLRAAMHPGRPPPLELRPHPLRETQTSSFLRTLSFSTSPKPRSLWAGHECGVRFFDLDAVFCSHKGGMRRRGDETAAPFRGSVRTAAAYCLVADEGRGVVWSGHRDGRIRAWVVGSTGAEEEEFEEGVVWQAHRGPVISLAITSYGNFEHFLDLFDVSDTCLTQCDTDKDQFLEVSCHEGLERLVD